MLQNGALLLPVARLSPRFQLVFPSPYPDLDRPARTATPITFANTALVLKLNGRDSITRSNSFSFKLQLKEHLYEYANLHVI